MTAAMVRARSDGAGPSPAANARMAEDLEVPRLLRLPLTAGWNLSESVALPAAAYMVAAWLDGRDTGLVAGVTATWVTAVIPKRPRGGAHGNLAHRRHPQGRDRNCAQPADDFRGGAHGADRGGAGHRRALALPAAVPAREPVHVRPVRPDGERPEPARCPAGRRSGRAAASSHPSPGPAPLLPGGAPGSGRESSCCSRPAWR